MKPAFEMRVLTVAGTVYLPMFAADVETRLHKFQKNKNKNPAYLLLC